MRPFLSIIVRSALIIAVVVTSVAGQSITPDRVLLPVATDREWEGGYGSRWVSKTWVVNDSSDPVEIFLDCHILCAPFFAEPGDTLSAPGIVYPLAPNAPGVFMLIESGGAEKLRVSLRIQDVSRQSLTWGTELPVVREGEFTTGVIHLLDIPVESRFRQALRIYSMSDLPALAVVRIVPISPPSAEPQVVEEVVDVSSGTVQFPGYAQRIDFVNLWPQLAPYSVVRIEVQTLDPSIPLWAFVSITNNETQHVTLSTPRE